MNYRLLLAVGAIPLFTQVGVPQNLTAQAQLLDGAREWVPTLLVGDADLNCSFLEFNVDPTTVPLPQPPNAGRLGDLKLRDPDVLPVPFARMTARIQGAGPSGFRLFAQPGDGRRLDYHEWIPIGIAKTDPSGQGELKFRVPLPDDVPFNTEIAFFAVYRDFDGRPYVSDVVPFIFNPMPRGLLSLERDMTGARLPAGAQLDEQWQAVGVHISATSAEPLVPFPQPPSAGLWKGLDLRDAEPIPLPDKAIVYDSSDPFGKNPDLVTPGYGWFNERAYRNLLVIAANDIDRDGDGLVDQPQAARNGGVVTFVFDEPTGLFEIVLVDVDEGETVAMRGFNGNRLVQDLLIAGMGDNSIERIGFAADKVTRLEVEFEGSAAIAQLSVHGNLDRTLVVPRDGRDGQALP